MSEHDGGNTRHEDIDTGPPVEVLATLAQSPGGGFLGGIRRAIHRRILVSQAADLSWNGPLLVLMEYLKALFEIFQPADTKER